MSHTAYRAELSAIAAAEMDGESVESMMGNLARRSGVPTATIRHEVTEIQDL